MLSSKQTNYFFSTVFFVFLSLFVFLPQAIAVDENFGLETSAKDTGLIVNKNPTAIAGTIVSAVLSFVGVIFFLLVLYGGLRWMIAQGNEQEVEKAKQILVTATIGLIIVLAAYAITSFIGQQLAGGN